MKQTCQTTHPVPGCKIGCDFLLTLNLVENAVSVGLEALAEGSGDTGGGWSWVTVVVVVVVVAVDVRQCK